MQGLQVHNSIECSKVAGERCKKVEIGVASVCHFSGFDEFEWND
jgi:hypothetical protein